MGVCDGREEVGGSKHQLVWGVGREWIREIKGQGHTKNRLVCRVGGRG